MMQFTPLRPLATVEAWQAQLEADLTNPKRTEVFTVGPGFPPGYDPHGSYTWTSVVVLALYDDNGDEIPLLNPPSASIAMPELQSGHGSGWAQAQVITLEPGLVPADFNPTVAKWYTDPMPMAAGMQLADQVDAGGGPPRTDVIRIPRPLLGEQPTENDATWIVLAISDDSQRNDFPQGTHWNAYLPKVERGDFAGIQHSLYAYPDLSNVGTVGSTQAAAQGPLVTSLADTVADSLRAVPGLGDVILTAPTPSHRPRLDAQRAALVFAPSAGNSHQLRQDNSPMSAVLDGVEEATLYTVVKFAQGAVTETAWSLGVDAANFWSTWWANGTLIVHRHSGDEANAPGPGPDFSVVALRGNKTAPPEIFIDGQQVGSGSTVGPFSSNMTGGRATLGVFATAAGEIAGSAMVGAIAEWTLCMQAHSNQQIDTKSAALRAYWQTRGLVFNPLPPLPPPPPPGGDDEPPEPGPLRHTIVGLDTDRDGDMDVLVSHTIEEEEP